MTNLYPERQVEARTAEQSSGKRQEGPQDTDAGQGSCHCYTTICYSAEFSSGICSLVAQLVRARDTTSSSL